MPLSPEAAKTVTPAATNALITVWVAWICDAP
jgi:hypothetical protein